MRQRQKGRLHPRHASRTLHYTSRWTLFLPPGGHSGRLDPRSHSKRPVVFQGQYHKRARLRAARAAPGSRVTRKLTRFQLTAILSD